jgi:hypothetical protein
MLPPKNFHYLFWGMHLGALCIAILLHCIGLFAIYLYQKKTNQNLILSFLSFAEILIALCGIAFNIDAETSIIWKHPELFDACVTIPNISIYELVLMMYILTVDRMICVVNPLKYKLRMTRTKIKILILISWIISITLGVLRETIPYPGKKWINVIFTGIGVLYIIVVIVTYSIVIIRVKRSRELFRTTNVNQEIKFKKEFLVPGLIILTLILFYAIPYPIYQLTPFNPRTLKEWQTQYIRDRVCEILQVFGLVIDPIIYVFLTKHYRDIIMKKCVTCRRSNEAQVQHRANDIPLEEVHQV